MSQAPSLEKYREQWLLQLIADPDLKAGDLRVAIAISFHMNRKKNGLAWPGMGRLAKLTHTSPSTVIRATKRLEARGHLRVIRSRMGEKRGLNRYLPLLKSAPKGASKTLADTSVMTLGSVKRDTPVVSRMTHKPLNEPLSKPLSYTDTACAVSAKKYRTRLEEEIFGPSESQQTSPLAQCYRDGRKWFGEGSAGIIGLAVQNGKDPDEIREALDSVRESGGDVRELAYELWEPQ